MIFGKKVKVFEKLYLNLEQYEQVDKALTCKTSEAATLSHQQSKLAVRTC